VTLARTNPAELLPVTRSARAPHAGARGQSRLRHRAY